MRSLRNTARVFKNTVADKVVEIEGGGNAGIAELAPHVSGKKGRQVLEDGAMEEGIWTAGMVMGLIRDIPTVSQLIERIVADAEQIIDKRLSAM